ncbi:hypothetical protein RHGRI_014500 [Rhododendron griersonianum]|uniref:peroxidase n=1 Tax=Rhododendron griersonianum TaxID=479676 RepID=A0AAV6K9Z4_9ERIC|nr:hypothetical protein RHGRI_014500 [Rhododendron griersonianum]
MLTNAQVTSTFYDNTCPNALTIRTSIRQAVSSECRMAASLIHLHFHDCFVQGCDASILLDVAATAMSERTALPNARSARDQKAITLPCVCNIEIKHRYTQEMPHIGYCNRIYSNGSNIDASFTSTRRRTCPAAGNRNLAPLDLVTPNSFDNNYFKNLIQKKGLLESDQVLFNGGSTDSIVSEYSTNPATFKADFAAAMIKYGNIIDSTTSKNGVERRICSALN